MCINFSYKDIYSLSKSAIIQYQHLYNTSDNLDPIFTTLGPYVGTNSKSIPLSVSWAHKALHTR